MTTTTDRERILRIIKPLEELATHPGTSEEEAAAALDRLSKLRIQYAIQDHELRDTQPDERIGKVIYQCAGKRIHAVYRHAGMAIADYHQCRTWYTPGEPLAAFFGHESDTYSARAMLHLLIHVAETEYTAYQKRQDTTYGDKGTFMRGFCSRISARLRNLSTKEETEITTATGNALVVLDRQGAVTERFKSTGIHLCSGSSSSAGRRGSRSSYEAGSSAGNRAHLGQSLTSSTRRLEREQPMRPHPTEEHTTK